MISQGVIEMILLRVKTAGKIRPHPVLLPVFALSQGYFMVMIDKLNIFLTGVGFMFSLTVAFLFYQKRAGILSALVIALMLDIALCFAKDIVMSDSLYHLSWMIDMTALPLYAGVLYELCMPGHINLKTIALCELPFILLIGLWCIFPSSTVYNIDLALAVSLGIGMAIWAIFAIPRYNRTLKTAFSYDNNIDLRWLQYLLWTFFIILSLWALSCLWYKPWLNTVYLFTWILLWGLACRFIYRHKSVIDELTPVKDNDVDKDISRQQPLDDVFERIRYIIHTDKIYLNAVLKLSDVARLANTNRTYASAYFNSYGVTFYDYINRLRVEQAKILLVDKEKRIDDIATESGFNSRRSFHRTFTAFEGKTPAEYRNIT